MTPTLRAMLTEIVDYAGLFPPARLDLAPAVQNYNTYRDQPEQWMLARFVCPAARLAEAIPLIENRPPDAPPLRFSVLGRSGDNRESFCTHFREDLAETAAFCAKQGSRVAVEAFEVRLPADWAGRNTKGRFFRRIAQLAREDGRDMINPSYFEVALDGDWRDEVAAAVEHLADFNGDDARTALPPAGLKLRCGGLEPAAFPTCEQVASVIELCRDAAVPLKFTAGLHHPIRHMNHAARTYVHGFVNVFAAGILAYSLGLEHHDIRAILEEEDPGAFSFSDEFLGWNDAEATISEITYARKHRVIAFGSCSFDEPREDLRALGWL